MVPGRLVKASVESTHRLSDMGKHGPKPTPANVLELRGSKRAKKRAEQTVKVDPIVPNCPDWLPRDAKNAWRYLAPELEKNALLSKRDREAFALACMDIAIARAALREMMTGQKLNISYQDDTRQGRQAKNPAAMVYRQAVDSYRRWCGQFGLTPIARIGLNENLPGAIYGGEDEDEDSDLFGSGSG